MEIILYSIVVGLLWLVSLTILLPLVILLKFSKTVQNLCFINLFKIIGPIIGPQVQFIRIELMNMFQDILKDRDISVPLKVCEIGIGPGFNFKYYPENTYLIALDPNPDTFKEDFEKNKAANPQVRVEKVLRHGAEDMRDIETSSVDAVVCTYVLCSVDDGDKVMSEIFRILKPGGHFVFLEHTIIPKIHQKSRLIQEAMDPLWSMYMAGCRLCNNPKPLIEKAGFSNVTIKEMLPDTVILFVRHHVIGIAKK